MKIIHVIVVVSGACVLALEVLGMRIVAPFYGQSIFLWSALITVTLTGLSAGYLAGGMIADRRGSLKDLVFVLGGAGVWILLIPLISSPVLGSVESLGLRWAVLIGSFLLFFPPLALLGIVSPYAVKLKAGDLKEVGRTAGSLYALSTVASVFSALVTGYFLIPDIGITRLTLGIGLVLIILAISVFVVEKSGRGVVGAAAAVLLSIAGIVFLALLPDPIGDAIAYRQSPYGELRVLDYGGERYLLIDREMHSVVDTNTWRSHLRYAAVMDIPRYMFPDPGSLCLIGLGAGSLAKMYHMAGWHVDAIEVDSRVVDMARSYFDLKDNDASVTVMDGRLYLASGTNQYDLIIFDAFGSSTIPFHLVTVEAFRMAKGRLNENGILALNVISEGWEDVLVRSLAATLRKCFRHVAALPISEPPNTLGNLVLIASDRELELTRELERPYQFPDYRFSPAYDKVHAWDNRFDPPEDGVVVLTDDRNPVDIWSERIQLASRTKLNEFWNEEGIRW